MTIFKISRFLIFSCLIIYSFFPMQAQEMKEVNHYGENPSLKDAVLIYYGGSERRLNWTREQFVPYVTHTFQDGRKTWFFPGFIFLEFAVDGKSLIHLNDPNATYSTQQEWLKLLEKTFAKNYALDALDKCIEQQKKELGTPPFKHKVILPIPSPVSRQKKWGSVFGKKQDFGKSNDRFNAIKWFISEMLNEFSKAKYRNIVLDGFYWVEEEMGFNNDIMPQVISCIKSHNKKAYWIPFYTARGSWIYYYFGFDYVYIQPNYFFNLKFTESRFLKTLENAHKLGWGLEIEFDDKLFYKPSVFVPRLKKYIDLFEEKGVYRQQAAITYYDGGSTLWNLYSGKYPYSVTVQEEKSIKNQIDRMAQHVVERNGTRELIKFKNKKSNQKSKDWQSPEYWHF